MTQWEYKLLDSRAVPEQKGLLPKPKAIRDIEEYFNRLGEEGWEIVNLDFKELGAHREFFGVAKRPKDG
jgi:hypothetical protein